MTNVMNTMYLDTTYTIRRLGCTAWDTGVRFDRALDGLREANDTIHGHVLIGESGPLEGEVVDPAALSDAIIEAGLADGECEVAS